MLDRRALIAAAAFAGAAPAVAQTVLCSTIPDRDARSDCYDRLGRAPPPARPPPASVCTPASPCTDPRGGVYYVSKAGIRRYLPSR